MGVGRFGEYDFKIKNRTETIETIVITATNIKFPMKGM
jgi:hypothetical protein